MWSKLIVLKSHLASTKMDFSSSGLHPSRCSLFSLALSICIEESNVAILQKKEKNLRTLLAPELVSGQDKHKLVHNHTNIAIHNRKCLPNTY